MNDKKLVVITGTSSGLGLAVVESLASAGYRIVGISRRAATSDLLSKCGNDYQHVSYDLGEIEGIPSMAKSIIHDHGTPYALINNAAIGLDGLLLTMHNSEIEMLVRTNVLSPIVLTKYLSRPMLDARKGRVVNISSVVAKTGYRGLSVYAATKAALEGFSRSFARDVGSRGITVNCVAPGFMETQMTSTLEPNALQKINRRSALGRAPLLSEVAASVSYLLSEAAAGVTGTTITVDAGNTA